MKLFAYSLRRWSARMLLLVLDLSFLSLALWLSFWLRFKANWAWIDGSSPQKISSYWLAFVMAVYLVITQLAALQMYAVERVRSWHEEVHNIFRAVVLAAVVLLAVSFFYREITYSRQMVIMAIPLAVLGLSFGRLLFRGFLMALREQGYFVRRVLIVGGGPMVPVIVEKVEVNKRLGFQICGILGETKWIEGHYYGLIHRGEFADLEQVLTSQKIRTVFVSQEHISHAKLLEFIEVCERLHVEILLIPQVYDLLIGFSGLRDLHGLPMMELREEPVRLTSLAIKRVLDFTVGLFLLVWTFPLMLAVAILIRLDSPGPALFFQERIGHRGRTFRMWKFRSMVMDAQEKLKDMVNYDEMKEPVFKFEKDPRVTRIGRWLRKTSIDELPQLVNVILGQMSLVGPRPEEADLVKRYNVWQRRRLKVKPGITGLQQIKCRGSNSLEERVKYDIFYIRQMSFLLDLEIMFRTILVVASQKGAS